MPPFSGCPLYKTEMQAEKSLVKKLFTGNRGSFEIVRQFFFFSYIPK